MRCPSLCALLFYQLTIVPLVLYVVLFYLVNYSLLLCYVLR